MTIVRWCLCVGACYCRPLSEGLRYSLWAPCGFASFRGDIGPWRVRVFPTHRSPQKNTDEIAVLEAQSAEVLGRIRGLL